MVVVPVLNEDAIATPWKPAVMLKVATDVLEDDQRTIFVRSCNVPSPKIPVAVYCSVAPSAILWDSGLTIMDTNSAGVTVNAAAFDITPDMPAVIVVVPSATEVASPVLLMVATAVLDEVQATDDDIS